MYRNAFNRKRVQCFIKTVFHNGIPVSQKTWTKYTLEIIKNPQKISEQNMKLAAEEVYQIASVNISKNDRISLGVSFDCSWNSRGWQAKQGVVAAIAQDNGKIIDVSHKVSYCRECTLKQNDHHNKKISSLEYLEWFLKHEINWYLNHTGPQVHTQSIIALYQRSIGKNKLMYDPFVGDGDSSAYREVWKLQSMVQRN